MCRSFRVLLGLFCPLIFFGLAGCEQEASPVSFANDIRPILGAKCMSCHGGVRQLGGLSFLFEEDMYKELRSEKMAVVPGKPEESEVYRRIISEREGLVMPPEGDRLNETEVELIRRWIAEGAAWEEHWAYVRPELPAIPAGAEHPVDAFVGKTLLAKGLSAAPAAAPTTLIRRLYLDLIGLPPSPEVSRAFADNPTEEAYQQVIDELLASEHFGERWASFWLDLARYADSQGYQKDHIRKTMFLYRDWVIEAFNQDMPIDSFTLRQLAGDLFPAPTGQDLLATAFHRNTMTNDEGGTDDEEFRVKAVMDRANVTMEVWQGSTFSCVQCHSHPYDPVRHEEYYAVKGYFNNTADADLTSDEPKLPLQSAARLRELAGLERALQDDTLSRARVAELEAAIAAFRPLPVPVMQDLLPDSSRINRLFVRGNWLMEADTIEPAPPTTFDKTGKTFPPNRLGLAQWLVDEGNPMTGRVLVNRVWEQLFGRGIVKTLEDFGVQGEKPTHPELLDWLAINFTQAQNWRLKSLLRTIVSSQTYRQSSSADSVQLALDPDNRWLARGPRFRLSAEQIRDQALVVSGLFNPKVYGPSVMPHQPEGVWNVIRHVARWKTSPDGQNHRRGLYTFYRRASPYPTMLLFDAPSRELCVSRRIRTNTPLQAMVTLNDPVFVEAAEALAAGAMEAHNSKVEDQIAYAFERATASPPDDFQSARLQELYALNLAEFQAIDSLPNSPELAAMETVCRAILNLDEVLVKR
ncbi:PSD1 and planctomycete cytochrome C domain-containing protein [Neolewinella agarilytica]|uniref:PSD1 and planctomycete cytochrome C domain-containing protein n=1 Tax=Neolewinella agarilytica TaxID=478744 RepID=UPI0023555A9A|nr:PSD1 and planctomycete cytochrome C domain-containing protein [Neolewinella agarilytica]